MKIVARKSVRFSDLVQKLGRPEQLTLWTEPEKDSDFLKAVAQRRVVTLIQRNVGNKADFGVVGFFRRPQAVFLVFPKAIAQPEETKVIGIKYKEIEEGPVRGEIYKMPPPRKRISLKTPSNRTETRTTAPRKAKPAQPAKAKKTPPVFKFHGTLEITATQKEVIQVEAGSEKEAMALFRQKAGEISFNALRAVEKRRLTPVRRVKA